MREKVRDKERLQHILNACDVLIDKKDKYARDEVEQNPILYFGFVRLVEIIGEAVYGLTKDFRQQHPEVEWDLIEDMRHVLVHGYYHIRPQQLWQTIEKDVVELRPVIASFLTEL